MKQWNKTGIVLILFIVNIVLFFFQTLQTKSFIQAMADHHLSKHLFPSFLIIAFFLLLIFLLEGIGVYILKTGTSGNAPASFYILMSLLILFVYGLNILHFIQTFISYLSVKDYLLFS